MSMFLKSVFGDFQLVAHIIPDFFSHAATSNHDKMIYTVYRLIKKYDSETRPTLLSDLLITSTSNPEIFISGAIYID